MPSCGLICSILMRGAFVALAVVVIVYIVFIVLVVFIVLPDGESLPYWNLDFPILDVVLPNRKTAWSRWIEKSLVVIVSGRRRNGRDRRDVLVVLARIEVTRVVQVNDPFDAIFVDLGDRALVTGGSCNCANDGTSDSDGGKEELHVESSLYDEN
jgi:hypothetical protein